MKLKTTIYLPCGFRVTRAWSGGTRPSLAWLQAAVGGGLIEPVDRFTIGETFAYAHEEGRILNMAPNPHGARAVRWPGDLRGPVVVCVGWTWAQWEGGARPETPEDLGTARLMRD